jgi:hypothetical protein
MKRTLLIIILILPFIGCENEEYELEIPSCIEKKIDEIKSETTWNPPAQIWKWETTENTYYYITSDCCDQWNYLYDEKCNVVCAPDGGINGMGDGNCPELSEPIVKSLIWSDDRN